MPVTTNEELSDFISTARRYAAHPLMIQQDPALPVNAASHLIEIPCRCLRSKMPYWLTTEPPTPPVRSAHHGGAFLLTMACRPGFRISQNSLLAADRVKSLIRRGMAVPDDGLATQCLTHR